MGHEDLEKLRVFQQGGGSRKPKILDLGLYPREKAWNIAIQFFLL